ncbi:MAG TPA: histidine kinase [Thermoanaerobaculia bacterium]|nr:histidine kinase [Thermoanaerobaculia bacterium]
MLELSPPQSLAERLIASGRVVLAASSLFAVWLDPSEPAKYAGIAYGLLVAYLGYSVVVAWFPWRLGPPPGSRRLLSHAFDLLFFSLFIYFTSGPSSPFVAFFVFSVACATLRWQWRGTLWTAVAALSAYLAAGLYFGLVLHDPTFQLHWFIIRGVYLAVLATLLGYLGFHEHLARRRMSLLAAWRQRPPVDADAQLRDDVESAMRVLACRSISLAWTESEEPWLHLVSWDGSTWRRWREAPPAGDPLVASDLAGASFFSLDVRAPETTVWRREAGRLVAWRGAPLVGPLAAAPACRSVLSCPLEGVGIQGRVFFFDRRGITLDELTLAEVVAGALAVGLEHRQFTATLRLRVADEERLRVARDLHDGVLQSLAGIGLQLAAVARRLDDGDLGGRAALEAVRERIGLEQRDLRFLIDELRPRPSAGSDEEEPLPGRLAELAERIEREWDLAVELDVDAALPAVAETLARDVYLLIREGLINAVRHGRATRARVSVSRHDRGLTIRIADNGSGFPITGHFTQSALRELGAGPRNLQERLGSLDGSLELDSSPAGACLTLDLPLASSA